MQGWLSILLRLCEDDVTLTYGDSVKILNEIMSGIACSVDSNSCRQKANLNYKVRDD